MAKRGGVFAAAQLHPRRKMVNVKRMTLIKNFKHVMPMRLNNSEWEDGGHPRCRHLAPRPTHIQRRMVPYALKSLDFALRMCRDPDHLIENSQSYIIHGCGHIPLVEYPALSARIYKDFLRKVSNSASGELMQALSQDKMPAP